MSELFLKKLFDQKKNGLAHFPDKELAEEFINQLFNLLFIPSVGRQSSVKDLEKEFESLKSHLSSLVYDVIQNGEKAQEISSAFFGKIPAIYDMLLKDGEAILKFDPAAKSLQEVIVAYPGFYAIAVYRLSHELWQQDVNVLPRLFTEHAHSKTGIDIHPGARIGEYFFIDHGTGIVIGETTVIGNNVKIYQGVTIGALNGSNPKTKRHPTIEDNVIIYSGTTIVGGETVIGRDSVIGGNVWLTYSIPPASVVYHQSELDSKENFSFAQSADYFI
ncbi:MAG: serine acetyltransferase [Chitinophagaceae bacterium]|nr:serine acetyltransferase [Chitinophagaceae bacterium]